MPPRLVPTLIAATFLGGCVSYEPKELTAAATQTQLEQRRLTDPGLEHFLATNGAPAAGEWSLARLTLAAFYFNPELAVARAQFAEAEAGVRTAEARPNPTFAFTPGRSDFAPGGISPWILGYALQIPVETSGKRTHRTTEAQSRADLARLDLAARAWSVHSAVRRALTDLRGAEETAALWREQAPLVARASKLLDAQVAAGDVSPLQATQASTVVAQSELAARESERAAANARSRLAETIGIPMTALAGVPVSRLDPSEFVPPPAVGEARTWAAQNRADLLALLAAYAATQAALQGEIARQYPDFTLGPGYQLDQGAGKWSLGIGVTLPVFHQNQGPIAAATARREAAAARFVALQNRVLAEVDRALADYDSALADLQTSRALRRALERQADIVRAGEAAGDTSHLDLVRSRIELANQARTELAVRLRAAQARSAIEDAVQRPLAWPESAWRNDPRGAGAKSATP